MIMLRNIIPLVCLAAFTANAGEPLSTNKCAPNQPITAELQPLQGTWEGVMVGSEAQGKITITVTGNSFHFHRDTNFWFDTNITLPPNKNPKEFHATIRGTPASQTNSIGQVVGAIYKIEDGTFTIIASGSLEEMPKSFDPAETQNLSRYEFRKIGPQNKSAPPPTFKETQRPGASRSDFQRFYDPLPLFKPQAINLALGVRDHCILSRSVLKG